MAFLQYSQLDLNGLAPLNFKHETLSSDLTANSGNVGRTYFNSTSGGLRYHRDSSTIVRLDLSGFIADADVAAAASIAESKLNLATDAASGTGSRRTLGFSGNSAMPGTARLDQLAVPTADVSLNSHKLTSVTDPGSAQDAATKNYVDSQITSAVNGHDWKDAVVAASTANVTVASALTNGSVMDTVTLATGDRVLLKDQTTASQNGIYVVVASGAASRSTDADNSNPTNEVTQGMTVPVAGGTQKGVWILTTPGTITLGTTSLTFTNTTAGSYSAGTGISISGNVVSIENSGVLAVAHGGTNASTASAARTSLAAGVAGGIVAQSSALTAGTEATFSHSFGQDGSAVARDVTSKAQVGLLIKCSSTQIKVTADVAVSSGALEFVFTPAGS